MRKLTITAALIAAFFSSAKAQSIEVITDCQTAPRTVNLILSYPQSPKLEHFAVGSHCPTQQFPRFRLEVGNYSIEDVPVRKGETFFYKVERKGKTIQKGELVAPFFTPLLEDDKLTIIIAAPQACNCDTKK